MTVELEAKGSEDETRAVLDGLDGVAGAAYAPGEEGTTRVTLTPAEGVDPREAIFQRFATSDVPLIELRKDKATLEDVFLELTQGEQDAAAAEAKEEAKGA